MQNHAIKTLKAIRVIHNEPHQQQVHMGRGAGGGGGGGSGSRRWHKQLCSMAVWDSAAH